MPRSLRFVLGAAFLLVATPFFLAACDGGDVASDVDSLLIDARIARQSGDIDTAIALLETAMAQAPSNAPVRVELSSAYLDRGGIDLLDVDRVALFLTTFEENLVETPDAPVQNFGGTCQYADDPNTQPFAPDEYEGYVELYADRDLINSVLGLLNGVDPTGIGLSIIPEELRVISLCQGIVDGQLIYDRDSALASMSALGLSDDEITTALAVNAVARFFEAYFFIAEDIPQQTSWYHVQSPSGDYVGVCADDQDALRAQVEVAVADLGESITSLDLRDHVLGGGTASQELVQHVLDAYESIEGDLGPYCEGGE